MGTAVVKRSGGQPECKDSSGDGANWGTGIASDTADATVLTINSRLDFDGTVAPTDLSRATDARDNQRIGIFGSALSYAGNSGRVTSEPLGRDLNPLGRGDGYGYMAGALNVGKIAPRLPLNRAERGSGFSINNSDQVDPTPDGGGGGGKQDRPWCCQCEVHACCGMIGLNKPPGDPNLCCCPAECSYGNTICVGDGGIDDCGAVCELSDSACSRSGGKYLLPFPTGGDFGGSGGGCPGCGGGGGLPTDPGFGYESTPLGETSSAFAGCPISCPPTHVRTSETAPMGTALSRRRGACFEPTGQPGESSACAESNEACHSGIFGSALSYAGNSGRVTSEPIGRDLNPLGRGDG